TSKQRQEVKCSFVLNSSNSWFAVHLVGRRVAQPEVFAPLPLTKPCNRSDIFSPAVFFLSESITAASSAMVGNSNRWRKGISLRNALRNRETTCVALSECPPRSKKLSWIPIGFLRRISAHIPAMICSAALRG